MLFGGPLAAGTCCGECQEDACYDPSHARPHNRSILKGRWGIPMYRTLLLLALGFAATAQAQPATLTLACKGTTTEHDLSGDQDAQPISMGIIVNFADRTVRGWDWPFDLDALEIGYVNDTEVRFGGKEETGAQSIIVGSINRVTGDVQATWSFVDKKTGKLEPHITYALQCRPAQRMF
jgi:hypothetical protein